MKALELFAFFIVMITKRCSRREQSVAYKRCMARSYMNLLGIYYSINSLFLCMLYQCEATLLCRVRTVPSDLIHQYCFFLALLFYNIVQLMNKLGDSTNRSSLSLTLRLPSNPWVMQPAASPISIYFLSFSRFCRYEWPIG